ncbi:uncharacterized protein LOC103508016 [Diaphorina citri]|uniref:Uncharacterized protein LOC103508016 n=1 Tax=Diaphorina citri TaxID=121845 RepID=A0A1S3CZ45_DIACI|nr:uncharacterized protein LOC103508016 [Diaphorina citri]KAI5707325.1 hypothetical protein M8J77_000240 [Diaphorina citri]
MFFFNLTVALFSVAILSSLVAVRGDDAEEGALNQFSTDLQQTVQDLEQLVQALNKSAVATQFEEKFKKILIDLVNDDKVQDTLAALRKDWKALKQDLHNINKARGEPDIFDYGVN